VNGFFRSWFRPVCGRWVVRAMPHATFTIEPRQQEGCLILHLRGELDLAARESLLREGERHGSPAGEADTIDLAVQVEGPRLMVTVRDHGAPFTPPTPALPDPAAFAEHGRGLFLMHHLMDEVKFSRDAGTVVRMTKIRRT
jgi:hypothetical protein